MTRSLFPARLKVPKCSPYRQDSMATAMESPMAFPESPMDPDDVAYPCKGCGQVSCPTGISWRTVTVADHSPPRFSKKEKHLNWVCPSSLLNQSPSLILVSRKQMAYRLLPLQHLRHSPRFRRQPSSSRRWLPHMQQLYIQL